ncbi:hypothetical protein INT47_008182 [Mucor saturninus]|uniref:Arrestin-like N-terminal domain-containing protein n=1 Tax=Mucor saturninus TaxID=64648 RepID=A0A8H7R404_9FUNG|nr:hypothetical protein INT47_008182 [Mucor saturninus]
MTSLPANTLTVPATNTECSNNNNTNASRRLSQTITDIVTGSTPTGRNRSSSSPPSPTKLEQGPNKISIEFDGGGQIIVRPNRIVRGVVILNNVKQIQASQIRIRFRAEEMATAKVKEYGLETKIERIDQVITTYFDTTTKVWGTEPSPYLMSSWDAIEPGEHKFPFALKFPNVNFPPSTDDPVGFSIHYIWSAHLDGPSYNPGMQSKEYIMPYRPIVCAPPTKEWTFNQTIINDKRVPIAHVAAIMPRGAFCPDEDVQMQLVVESIPSDLIVSSVGYTLNKCSVGQLQLQRGLARKTRCRKILQGSLGVSGNNGGVRVPVNFHVPTRLVSPSFQSRHLCVYYEIVFNIQFTSHGGLLKSNPSGECTVPIGITNLPHNHLLHIPNLTSVQSYLQSKESPIFFDPFLDEPPNASSIPSELWGPLTAALSTPPITSPPNYFSLSELPSQFIQRDREEKTVFTSRLIKAGMAQELGDPITLVQGSQYQFA